MISKYKKIGQFSYKSTHPTSKKRHTDTCEYLNNYRCKVIPCIKPRNSSRLCIFKEQDSLQEIFYCKSSCRMYKTTIYPNNISRTLFVTVPKLHFYRLLLQCFKESCAVLPLTLADSFYFDS